MIVTCSNCETKYNLPENKIAPGGSKVKCSKCGHLFKVDPPTIVEEEVEALLEEEAPAPADDAGDEFDKEFDEAMAEEAGTAEEPPQEDPELDTEEPEEPSADGGVDAPPADDFGDLFDDQEEEEGEGVLEGDEEQLFEEGSDPGEETDDSGDGPEEDEDMGGLFDDEESDDDEDDIFEDDDDEDEEEDEEDDDLFDDTLDLDEKPRKRGLGLIVVLLVVLLAGAGIYFQVWSLFGLDLSGTFNNIPYVGSIFSDSDMPDAAPGESPEQKVNKIELKNVRQFYAKNEKAGILFVIQGTAVNNFSTPRERIKVQAELFDAASKVVASKAQLCGNVLSMFQLQVQSRQEIEDGLASEVGILSNNTFLRSGASTPFMFVFFDQPVNDIKEFVVKVVAAKTPE